MKFFWVKTTCVELCGEQSMMGGWLTQIEFKPDKISFIRDPCYLWDFEKNRFERLGKDQKRHLALPNSDDFREEISDFYLISEIASDKSLAPIEFYTQYINLRGTWYFYDDQDKMPCPF